VKSYQVALVRYSYCTVFVEAKDEETAKGMAWDKVERGCATAVSDSYWDIEHVEEIEEHAGGAA